MTQFDAQNQKAKDDIKKAWAEDDLLGLLRAGIDNFFNVLSTGAPIAFQRFLEYTGISFDKYILDVSKREQLKYVGGKMTMSLEKDTSNMPIPISLSADFYFQTFDKKWVLKKKSGKVDSSRFSDWDSDTDAATLRKTGKLELSIEQPAPEGK